MTIENNYDVMVEVDKDVKHFEFDNVNEVIDYIRYELGKMLPSGVVTFTIANSNEIDIDDELSPSIKVWE